MWPIEHDALFFLQIPFEANLKNTLDWTENAEFGISFSKNL